jgi:peroxiredoxin
MSGKKVIIISLVLAMLALTGCGEANGGTNAPASPSAAEASSTAADSLTPAERHTVGSLVSIPTQDFTLPKTDGTQVTLSELKGKPIVLNFWATWCPYCVAEFEDFTKAQKNFPDIQLFAVDTSEHTDLTQESNREDVEKFARDNGFDLTILYDTDNKVSGQKYPTQGLPSTFFIDSAFNQRTGFAGQIKDYDTLETFLNVLKKVDGKE